MTQRAALARLADWLAHMQISNRASIAANDPVMVQHNAALADWERALRGVLAQEAAGDGAVKLPNGDILCEVCGAWTPAVRPTGDGVKESDGAKAITVFKDGGYKFWGATDAAYAHDDDVLVTIPIPIPVKATTVVAEPVAAKGLIDRDALLSALRKERDDYMREHFHQDPETGTWESCLSQEDHLEDLDNRIDFIEAFPAATPPTIRRAMVGREEIARWRNDITKYSAAAAIRSGEG